MDAGGAATDVAGAAEILVGHAAELRRVATQYPEWAPYVDQIGVEWSNPDGGFVFYWEGDEEHIKHFKGLEYGRTFGSIPKSVTRKTAKRMEDRAGKMIQEILEKGFGFV